jgi:hypothetical protein
MAASKKKVVVEVDVETLIKLVEAANALSEVAAAFITTADDPRAQKLAKSGAGKAKKPAKKRAKRG